MSFLQMSFTGAVMIMAVMIIRALCIHKLPKISFLILWVIVLLRLLTPVTIPGEFSIYSLVEKSFSQSILGRSALQTGEEDLKGSFSQKSGNMTAQEEQAELSETAEVSETAGMDAESGILQKIPDLSALKGMIVTALPVWKILWLVGLILCAGYFTAAYIKCRKEFQMSLPADNEMIKQWMKERVSACSGISAVRKPVEIRQSDCISTPISYGITHPVILLPKTDMINDAETMRYILEHEYVHIQRFDMVIKLLMTAAVCLHWFNPFVWSMYFILNRDIELSCDETVLWRMGDNGKSFYARMLINMEETKNKLTPFYNGFSKNALEERIVAIMKMKKNSKIVWVLATVLIVGVVVIFGSAPESVFATVSSDKFGVVTQYDSMAVALNAETTELIEDDGVKAVIEEEYDYKEALKKYEEFGVSDQNGLMYYKGERIRFFLDGYEMDGNIISRYQHYDDEGTVDVHTVRNDIQNPDGSTQLFGEIVDIVAYPQEEFDKRDYSGWWSNVGVEATTAAGDNITTLTEESYELAAEDTSVIIAEAVQSTAVEIDDTFAENAYGFVTEQTEEATITTTYDDTAENTGRTTNDKETTNDRGMTLKERVAAYKEYGITYRKTADGKEILYLDGLKIKTFVEKKPNGSIFSYSIDEGDVNVRILYNDNGEAIGIEKEYVNRVSE